MPRWICPTCDARHIAEFVCGVCGRGITNGADLDCAKCTDWFLRGEKAWREFVALESAIRNEQVDRADKYTKDLLWGPRPIAPYLPPFGECDQWMHLWKDGAATCYCGERRAENYGAVQHVTWRDMLVADGLLAP